MVRLRQTEKYSVRTINEEIQQAHPVRKELYKELETKLGRPVVAFATSFTYPSMITNSDAEMLEGALRDCDLSNGLALLISSPGGDLLAAERIINICRSYSNTNEYLTIVPSMAKSAASLICLGSSKILMSETSELGPIDPQIFKVEDGIPKVFSVPTLISSYDQLFERAVKSSGHIEPYLQQLANYDDREIAELRHVYELTEEIAINVLQTGMRSDGKRNEIKKDIKIFLSSEASKTHERPIRIDEVKSCNLKVEELDLKSEIWSLVYELGTRLDYYVSQDEIAKCIENMEDSWYSHALLDEDEDD